MIAWPELAKAAILQNYRSAILRISRHRTELKDLKVMPCTDQFRSDADLHDAMHTRVQFNFDCEALRRECTMIFRSICHCKAEQGMHSLNP